MTDIWHAAEQGNYSLHRGVLKQSIVTRPVVYDVEYVRSRYDQYPTTNSLSLLRLRLILDVVGLGPGARLLDVGYGNGDFLAMCHSFGFQTFGNDVSGYPVPLGTTFVKDILADRYGCVTFFDSLEHMPSIDFVGCLRASYVVISVPWCHYPGEAWFFRWKHRRPDEHIFHFGRESLCRFMADMGFEVQYVGNPEDVIRRPVDDLPNILTGIFKKN